MVRLRSAIGFAWVAAVAVVPGGATAAEPALVRLDEAFAERAAAIARRADEAGMPGLAALVREWVVPEPRDRQVVFAIPPRLEKPACVDTPGAEAAWNDFVAARQARAAGTFALALEAARAHATTARAAPAADAPPVARRSCAAVALVHRALRDDPEHARARAAAGYVRRGDTWTWPEVARRLDRGQEFSAEFGWLPRGRLARYRRGERHDRGRWLSAEADAARTPAVADGRHYDSDHWEILSAAPLESAAALAAALEETRLVWRQVFGACCVAPATLEARFEGRERSPAGEPFAAVLCATRAQYVAELEPLEPAAGLTQALYWRPTQTAWFFAAAAGGVGAPTDTIRHEAAHQLFAESAATSPLAGERSGFWALEAAACLMESVRDTPWGWTVGGLDAGRVPAARALVVEENFLVPLEELAALGRKEFQADPRLARIYDQLGGLADFFMHGRDGRYREAFVQYLGRVYAGTDDPNTLERLCGTTFALLDAEYRRYLSR